MKKGNVTPKEYLNDFFTHIIDAERDIGSQHSADKIVGIRNHVRKLDLRKNDDRVKVLEDLHNIVDLRHEGCKVCDFADQAPGELQIMWNLKDFGRNKNWKKDIKKVEEDFKFSSGVSL